MKSSRLLFLMVMASAVSGVLPYAPFEFKEDREKIYERLLKLANKCDCIDLKTGKNELRDIKSFYHDMKERSRGGCSQYALKEKRNMWLEIFKTENDEGKTLADVAADKVSVQSENLNAFWSFLKPKSFCVLLQKELEKMESKLTHDKDFR